MEPTITELRQPHLIIQYACAVLQAFKDVEDFACGCRKIAISHHKLPQGERNLSSQGDVHLVNT